MSCLPQKVYYSSFALNRVYSKPELMVDYLILYLNFQQLHCSNALLVQGGLYLNNIPPVRSYKMDCRSEGHTSELESRFGLGCRLLLGKKMDLDTVVGA